MSKAVLRYMDGRILKGRLTSFQQSSGFVRIIDQSTGFVESVRLDQLKAVFFVRDFEGIPAHADQKSFPPRPEYGRRTVVRFQDGEELWGYTQGYSIERLGFFLFPADKSSNNERVFVVTASTESVRFLGMGERPDASTRATGTVVGAGAHRPMFLRKVV